jgi:probable F420-dependent oxidoreductase
MTSRTPCGIAIPQTFSSVSVDVDFIRRFLSRAERLDYDSAWVQERIVGDYAVLEPVALLTYAAALTSRLRLGTSVLLTALRNPVQLAKSLATLDQLSQGRLTVGVGIGGHVPESIFGLSGEQRALRFVEGLRVMKALWTQPRATVSGRFWQFDNVPMEPKPVQKPHPPLWFGAREAVALKRAVRHGDGWMGAGISSSADFVHQIELIRRFLDDAQRDPATFTISKRVYVAVDDDRDRAERRLREWFGLYYKLPDLAAHAAIWGSRAECIDRLQGLVRAGAKHLLLNPVFDEIEHLELLAAEVVPRL